MKECLRSRTAFLRAVRNSDGGWGYYPGKESWLEPTCWAALALHADPAAGPLIDSVLDSIRTWQLPDGAWRPSPAVDAPHWSTALALTLHAVRNRRDELFHKGVRWLLETEGSEAGLASRLLLLLVPSARDYDGSFAGWPWLPGTHSWVEPTAHALIALRKARPWVADARLGRRISRGTGMLLDRRSDDGGWNFGDRAALGRQLPSYPETTACALLGLLGLPSPKIADGVRLARRYYADRQPPKTRALLAVALRNHGVEIPAAAGRPDECRDVMQAALEVMAEEDGPYRLLHPGAE